MQSKVPSSTLLFQALWPEHGHQFIATRDPATGKFSHIAVSTITHASEIVSRATDSGLDVYSAPASFKSNDSRKADNAIGAMSLWQDIDVGPEKAATSKGYATIEEAEDALVNSCAAIGIPQPTHIVHSGTGIQAYWAFEQFLPKDQWQPLSCKLKALCLQHGLLADPCRTADIASLMRVTGTFNHKYSPARPVTLEKASPEPIPTDIMVKAIEAAFNRLPQRDPSPECFFHTDEKTFDITICVAALRCLDPDIDYDDWFKVCAVLFNYTRGSEAGYELFDSWSSGGKKYKGHKDTLIRWRSLRLDHRNPIGLGTLCWMVREAGYDWQKDVVAVANEQKGGA